MWKCLNILLFCSFLMNKGVCSIPFFICLQEEIKLLHLTSKIIAYRNVEPQHHFEVTYINQQVVCGCYKEDPEDLRRCLLPIMESIKFITVASFASATTSFRGRRGRGLTPSLNKYKTNRILVYAGTSQLLVLPSF